jgi:hypothetical protein
VRAALAERGVGVLEALHVPAARGAPTRAPASCCPAEGTPCPRLPPVLGLVQAEQVATGRVVLPSRDDLVQTLAPPTLLAAVAAEQRLEQARQAWLRSRAEHGVVAARRRTLDHVQALLDRVAAGTPVGPADAAVLAVGLGDLPARDGVATLILTREDELLSLLVQVARQVVPPDDAPVCTLLAWTAYARGEGALANVALDRPWPAGPTTPSRCCCAPASTPACARRRCAAWPAAPSRFCAAARDGALGGLADRAHVEVRHAQRRHPHPGEAVAPLPRQARDAAAPPR